MEEWKPVVGFEGLYDVSNLGNVRTALNSPHKNARIHRGKFLNKRLRKNGYYHVTLNRNGIKKTHTVHSLVLKSFKVPRVFGMVSRHLDGNRGNNVVGNLEWSTQKENLNDRIIHGTDNKGERHPNAVLTDKDVLEMRHMKLRGLSNVEIARSFLVTPANVGCIVRNKSWTHI